MGKPNWERHYYKNWLFPEVSSDKLLESGSQSATVTGHFCEQYTMALLGGKQESGLGQFGVDPDVVFRLNGILNYDLLVECKGLSRTNGTVLTHDQINRYVKMEQNDFPLTDPKVYYAFCLHNVIGMTKNHATEVELVHSLGANYLGTVIIPLAVIKNIIEWTPKRPNASWNTSCDGPDFMTTVSGVQIHKLITGEDDPRSWVIRKAAAWSQEATDKALDMMFQHEVYRWRTPRVEVAEGFEANHAWLTMLLPKEK